VSVRAVHSLFVLFACVLCGTANAQAQSYPWRPIRMVIPFPGGGATDATARLFGQLLGTSFGQNIVADNRPGATGSIGAMEVFRANPDGHTILYSSSSFGLAPLLYKKPPYDPIGDFAHVQLTVAQPMVLVVNPQFPAKTLPEFIKHARANPKTINYGSSGSGGINHLTGAEFASRFGLQLSHVPYKGGAPALIDVVAGQIQMLFAPTGELLSYMQTQRVRWIAIAWPTRSTLLPDVPTFTEVLGQEYPGIGVWHGVMVPKGTSAAVISRLNAELTRAAAIPDVRQKLLAQGNVMLGGSPDEFVKYLQGEVARWGKVVKALELKPLD